MNLSKMLREYHDILVFSVTQKKSEIGSQAAKSQALWPVDDESSANIFFREDIV